MSRKSLRCVVEVKVHAVTCPGVYLPRRDDVYLSVCLLGQVRRTQLTSPVFPLVFHEKFFFDKVFYTAYQPSQVADSLEDEPVIVELIQLSTLYEGGRLLASYETNARDFLYPYPSFTPTYGTQDRDVLLERSLDFPGISPRLEFSTTTTIRDAAVPIYTDLDDDVIYASSSLRSPRRSRSRTRSPKRTVKSSGYGKHTVASASRARSLSPSTRRRFDALDLNDSTIDRPPFVVRKVNSRNLTGRDPGTQSPKRKIKCMHGTYGDPKENKKRSTKSPRYTADYLDLYTDNLKPTYRTQALLSSDDDEVEYYDFSDRDTDDLLDLTSSRTRYRSPSPTVYRSTLSDRYLERPYSPTRSEIIKDRVERTLERNKAVLDRYDRMYPYSSYRYRRDLAALDALELDLELSRRRRYPYLYY